MIRTISYMIRPDDAGKTIREFLREQGYSRHILASIKPVPEAVLRNGEHARLYVILREGDTLQVRVEDPVSSGTVIPAPVPFTIVYEDDDLLVIDKPSGVSIHPAPGHPADTLANGLAYYYQEKGIPFVFRGINRLDRDTTGLLLVAKNLISASILETALQAHEIRRTYLAIAEGELTEGGTIDLPIARKPGSLIERCVSEQGDRAVTHFSLLLSEHYAGTANIPVQGLSRTPALSELRELSTAVFELRARASRDGCVWCAGIAPTENNHHESPRVTSGEEHMPRSTDRCHTPIVLHLETGRTHQIRVHMAAIGHPLLGDSLYNPRWAELFEKGAPKEGAVFPYGLSRQALHSWQLEFLHPVTKEPMRFTAPVPNDLSSILSVPLPGE